MMEQKPLSVDYRFTYDKSEKADPKPVADASPAGNFWANFGFNSEVPFDSSVFRRF